MGDEITGNDNRSRADLMKTMITREQIEINIKYLPSYSLPDTINYLFTSNHPNAIFMDDHDRRYFVHEVQGGVMDNDFVKKYMAWLNGDGPSHLFHYLLNLPLGSFSHAAPALQSAAKFEMINSGKSRIDLWVSELKENPDHVLRLGGASLRGDLFSMDQLSGIYDADSADMSKGLKSAISRSLKRAGILGRRLTLKSQQKVTVYAVRNREQWAKLSGAKWIDHYEEHYADKARKY